MSKKLDAYTCLDIGKRLYGNRRIGINKNNKICCVLCGRNIEAKGKEICDCLNWKKAFNKTELTAIFTFNREFSCETLCNIILNIEQENLEDE